MTSCEHLDLSEGNSQLPAGLIEAYAQTEFSVDAQPAFTLYVRRQRV